MVVHNAFHIEPVLKKSALKITALDTVRTPPLKSELHSPDDHPIIILMSPSCPCGPTAI
jgi:hypothetical protein